MDTLTVGLKACVKEGDLYGNRYTFSRRAVRNIRRRGERKLWNRHLNLLKKIEHQRICITISAIVTGIAAAAMIICIIACYFLKKSI